MALPTTRNLTATAASQVNANLHNDLQDCIIGKKCPSMVRTTAPIQVGSSGVLWTGWGGRIESIGTQAASLAIPAEVGDRVTALQLGAMGNGVVDVTYDLYVITSSQTLQQIGSLVDTNRAAAWGSAVLSVPVPTVIGANECLLLVAAPSAAGYSIGSIRLTYDRL